MSGIVYFLSPQEADWASASHDFVMDDDFVMSSRPSDLSYGHMLKSISGEEFNPYCQIGQTPSGAPELQGRSHGGHCMPAYPFKALDRGVAWVFGRFLEKYPAGSRASRKRSSRSGNDGEHLELSSPRQAYSLYPREVEPARCVLHEGQGPPKGDETYRGSTKATARNTRKPVSSS